MLWRSFLEKCCRSVLVREVLETVSVAENCWENCWKEVLQKDAGRRVEANAFESCVLHIVT